MQSINPHDGKLIREYTPDSQERIETVLTEAERAFRDWRQVSFKERASLMRAAGARLRERRNELAALMADEMGKVLRDGVAEIEKCAGCCDFYAENAEKFLSNEVIASDAAKSYVAFDPLGCVLAVMPWNFPFWQVFRFAAPSLMAGNVGVLKHASNVSGCALAIQEIFSQAGFPRGVFASLLVPGDQVEKLIQHPVVKAVTLTGSTPAGRSVAARAGERLKKCVLELGGSDAYVVLADADLDFAVETCAKSRLINVGQSCIAAKRFIVAESLYEEFAERYVERFRKVRFGDPKLDTSEIGPMARHDLRDGVHGQVEKSVHQGAKLLWGGKIPSYQGAYYPPTVLGEVKPGNVAFDEEIFGPVAALIRAKDESEAVHLANRSEFGLGAAIFSKDVARAETLAREIEAGSVFINALVKSDSRLPFGGVKSSGFGRELSWFGIREFVNIKTIYRGGN